ncbi:MAG: DUF839 domain-containing protein [Deltaproteobacteria bacterium]|nr:DUF839 domain-containing protein [Nannocystaceae bacterium]
MRTIVSLRPATLFLLLAPLACADDVSELVDSTTSDESSSGTVSGVTLTSTTASTTDTTTADTSAGPTTATTSDETTTTTSPESSSSSEDESSSSGTTGEPPPLDTIPSVIRELVEAENGGTDIDGFPLEYEPLAGSLRVIPQVETQIDAAFLDPLTADDAATAPFWGANNDFNAYIGDGWEEQGSPYFTGSGVAGWMFTNFEYASNDRANVGAAPTGNGLQLVTWLAERGVPEFQFDVTDSAQWTAERVDAYILWHKRAVGAAVYRVEYDETEGWSIDTSATNTRFDGTSDTLFRIVGGIDVATAQDDDGNDLPANVVPGTSSNCSGGVTPWGTFISAEENVNFAYGELESCWSSANAFVSGPCNPGADIVWSTNPSGSADYTRGTATNTRPDFYAYLAEIDPEAAPGEAYDPVTGNGHLKIGSFGRAHWENATFHVGDDWNLVPDQPIVFYSGDDRRGGRIYKWVSQDNYTDGMTKAEIRNLLAEGYTYVAHFADLDNSDDAESGALGGLTVGGELPLAASPGNGQWILLSVTNDLDIAPNAGGGGGSMTTVGDALQDVNWNGMGGFPDDETVLLGLYSATNKIGVRELNRPEDLEWRPQDGSLWIAFTNHDRANALRDDGTLSIDDPDTVENERDAFVRSDDFGAIFVLNEEDTANPGSSTNFTFHAAWRGSPGATTYEAANPDNIAVDTEGGIWFGTDGNFGPEKQDAIYFLEVAADPADSRAWRIATMPSDAENTGPAFASDERTLFFSVQHPAEDLVGAPASDFAPFGELGPRSGRVSMTLVER